MRIIAILQYVKRVQQIIAYKSGGSLGMCYDDMNFRVIALQSTVTAHC